MLLVSFERIPKSQRLGLLTIFNVGNASAIALGAVAGSALLGLFESSREGYYLLFALSTAARLLPMFLLVKMPRLTVRNWVLATRSIAVRPSMGTIERPVLAGFSAAEDPLNQEAEDGDVPRADAAPDFVEAAPEASREVALPVAVGALPSVDVDDTQDAYEVAT